MAITYILPSAAAQQENDCVAQKGIGAVMWSIGLRGLACGSSGA
jgi:hypothetical protein